MAQNHVHGINGAVRVGFTHRRADNVVHLNAAAGKAPGLPGPVERIGTVHAAINALVNNRGKFAHRGAVARFNEFNELDHLFRMIHVKPFPVLGLDDHFQHGLSGRPITGKPRAAVFLHGSFGQRLQFFIGPQLFMQPFRLA